MKRILFSIVALLAAVCTYAQDYNFISDLPDDFEFLDTVPQKRKFFNEHLIGVQYGINISNVRSSPDVKQESIVTMNNVALLYTFYHALWDKMANFGLQFGGKIGYEGYKSPYEGFGETCRILEVPLLSQFKIDFSMFRLLVNIGPYYGYRLSTDKEGGFDVNDQRHDYGLIGGAGFAVVFRPFELHLEGNYKLSLASMYNANKTSELYWTSTYPSNIMISAGIFIHLDKKKK